MKSKSLVKTFFFVALPVTMLLVLLIYAGIELYAHLTTSSRFSIREVEIITNGPADKKNILQLAHIQIGENIFALDLAAVKHRVEQDPWVAAATISRALPDRIQIRYQAQIPAAILGAESLYYLNQSGVPFYKLSKDDSLDYPLLRLETGQNAKELIHERILSALQLLKILEKSGWSSPKDIGDISIRDVNPSLLLTMRYPPSGLTKLVKSGRARHFTASLSPEDLPSEVKRMYIVLQHLAQAGKNPRLIRLELGKKIVVKLDQTP